MAQVDSEDSTAMPAVDAGGLFRRTGISPETFFQALGRARKAARDEIARLIDWLDTTIDIDEDAAVDDEGCDGDPDAEGSLGSLDRMSDQIAAWSYRSWGDVDCELDKADLEPSLGWTPQEAGAGCHFGGSTRGQIDLEGQCEDEGVQDSGIGDIDGLREQCADHFLGEVL